MYDLIQIIQNFVPHFMIILTFSIVLIFSIQPLFWNLTNVKFNNSNKVDSLELRKLSIYEQIKELELEFDMGNISDYDFKRNRLELVNEVSEIIEKIK
tara:strand:+ start:4867 stop:5160 length:294 start_codon:yes stop_codon:yes gene_type:complete